MVLNEVSHKYMPKHSAETSISIRTKNSWDWIADSHGVFSTSWLNVLTMVYFWIADNHG